MRRFVQLVVLLCLLVASLEGCDASRRKWEVSVRNDGAVPASFFLTLGGSSKADVANVAPGPALSLIVGESPSVLQAIRVVRGSDEQTITPNIPLPLGARCLIVVDANGKIDVSLAGQ